MESYNDIVGGILLIVTGIGFILFHNKIGYITTKYINRQHKILRLWHDSNEAINKTVFLVVGILFIIFGYKLLN